MRHSILNRRGRSRIWKGGGGGGGGGGGTVQHHFVRSACFQIKFSESVGGTGLLRPPKFSVLLMNTVYVEADYVEADSVVNSLSCM